MLLPLPPALPTCSAVLLPIVLTFWILFWLLEFFDGGCGTHALAEIVLRAALLAGLERLLPLPALPPCCQRTSPCGCPLL